MLQSFRGAITLLFFGGLSIQVQAEELRVAVASNFYEPAKVVTEAFKKRKKIKVTLSPGSSGKHYAQIMQGAPFDVFLSADEEHIEKLGKNDKIDLASVRAYAVGRLVIVGGNLKHLREMRFDRLSIAHPRLAPYGAAAQEVLKRMGIWNQVSQKIVFGENISQAFHFYISGNADLGIVALSQVKKNSDIKQFEIVPKEEHAPIVQSLAILKNSSSHFLAREYVRFLFEEASQKVFQEYGYDLPEKSLK